MTLAEVCQKYGVTAETLNTYERAGLIPRQARPSSADCQYSEHDCEWIEFIRDMCSDGLPVSALAQYTILFQHGGLTHEVRKQILTLERDRLAAQVAKMQETLHRLTMKIELYEKSVVPAKKEVKTALRLIGSDQRNLYRS